MWQHHRLRAPGVPSPGSVHWTARRQSRVLALFTACAGVVAVLALATAHQEPATSAQGHAEEVVDKDSVGALSWARATLGLAPEHGGRAEGGTPNTWRPPALPPSPALPSGGPSRSQERPLYHSGGAAATLRRAPPRSRPAPRPGQARGPPGARAPPSPRAASPARVPSSPTSAASAAPTAASAAALTSPSAAATDVPPPLSGPPVRPAVDPGALSAESMRSDCERCGDRCHAAGQEGGVGESPPPQCCASPQCARRCPWTLRWAGCRHVPVPSSYCQDVCSATAGAGAAWSGTSAVSGACVPSCVALCPGSAAADACTGATSSTSPRAQDASESAPPPREADTPVAGWGWDRRTQRTSLEALHARGCGICERRCAQVSPAGARECCSQACAPCVLAIAASDSIGASVAERCALANSVPAAVGGGGEGATGSSPSSSAAGRRHRHYSGRADYGRPHEAGALAGTPLASAHAGHVRLGTVGPIALKWHEWLSRQDQLLAWWMGPVPFTVWATLAYCLALLAARRAWKAVSVWCVRQWHAWVPEDEGLGGDATWDDDAEPPLVPFAVPAAPERPFGGATASPAQPAAVQVGKAGPSTLDTMGDAPRVRLALHTRPACAAVPPPGLAAESPLTSRDPPPIYQPPVWRVSRPDLGMGGRFGYFNQLGAGSRGRLDVLGSLSPQGSRTSSRSRGLDLLHQSTSRASLELLLAQHSPQAFPGAGGGRSASAGGTAIALPRRGSRIACAAAAAKASGKVSQGDMAAMVPARAPPHQQRASSPLPPPSCCGAAAASGGSPPRQGTSGRVEAGPSSRQAPQPEASSHAVAAGDDRSVHNDAEHAPP
mmetsp:Transcript_7247/g.21127  ORF Transcript_7247/g.21127 Transcript_7247/m.21127 type:complete len:837 (+) Transcript_7247:215-2725(+)